MQQCNGQVLRAGEGQQTREQAHAARTEAGTHPLQICDFAMETHDGKKYTADSLKGFFSVVMFGDGVTDHALQGLHKMQEIVTEQGASLCHAATAAASIKGLLNQSPEGSWMASIRRYIGCM